MPQECPICHKSIVAAGEAAIVYVRDRSGSKLSISRRVHLTCLDNTRVVKLHDNAIIASRQGIRRR